MNPGDQYYLDSLGAVLHAGAYAYDKNGRQIDNTGKNPSRYSWSSSAPAIARVDQQGFITTLGWGTATITASHLGAAGTLRLVVQDAVRLAWSLPTDERLSAGPTIGRDGTIYVLGRNHLYALSPKGDLLWAFPTFSSLGNVLGTPAIGDDGTIYVVSLSGQGVAAVRPNGTLLWQTALLDPSHTISSSVALGPDGTIYAAGNDSLVYAVGRQGQVRWTYHATDGFFLSSPAVASDGTIYVGANDGALQAINPDGTRKWIFKADNQIQSSPSIGRDGTIYFGAFDGRLFAVGADGKQRWRTAPLASAAGVLTFYGSPAIAADGTIYVLEDGLVAINSDGSIRWRYGGNTLETGPVLGADGSVYVGGPIVHALDADGRLEWTDSIRRPYPYNMSASPVVGLDGTIVTPAQDGTIWAFTETTSKNGGFAGALWPKVRGDRANSGRAGGR